jgi:Fe-S oxidoreductase
VFTAFDILLIIIAVSILLSGLYRNKYLLRKAAGAKRSGNWVALGAAVLGQKKILDRPWVGRAHLVLVWGFIVFSLAVICAQFNVTAGPRTAQVVSILLDLIGLSMLVATLFFIVRRIVLRTRHSDLPGPRITLPPLFLLLLILLSGFMAEGSRLNLHAAQAAASAPVGWLFAAVTPESPLFMQLMLRLHLVAVLVFIAVIPFSFMRHLVEAASNIFHGNRRPEPSPPLALENPPFGARSVLQFDVDRLRQSHACVACGRCDEVCPAMVAGKPLTPSGIMGTIRAQLDTLNRSAIDSDQPPTLMEAGIFSEALWACTTCMACVARCPVQAQPLNKIMALRQYQVLDCGLMPAAARPMLRNLELFGDVNGKGAARRADWALGCEVPAISSNSAEPQILLWVGCSGAFHPVYRQTIRAMVKILQSAGVAFGILAHDEQCCGDPARRLGNEALFLALARSNIARFKQHSVTRIVALCPHCYHTLKNEYPALGAQVQVIAAVEYVLQLLRQGQIRPKYPLTQRVAVQDPCYLGRYNGIYQPLRDLCGAVPGVTLKEMPRHGAQGFCCGGGGGQMWLHESSGEKINLLRAREAAQSAVDTVCTACPYCLTMLEDGLKALEMDQPPRVVDIIEMVAATLP